MLIIHILLNILIVCTNCQVLYQEMAYQTSIHVVMIFPSPVNNVTNPKFQLTDMDETVRLEDTALTLIDRQKYSETFRFLKRSTFYRAVFKYTDENSTEISYDRPYLLTAPANPSVAVSAVTSTSFTITFSSDSTAYIYDFCYNEQEKLHNCVLKTVNNPHTVTNLKASTDYWITFRSGFALATSSIMETNNVKTAPGQPTVALDEATMDSITVDISGISDAIFSICYTLETSCTPNISASSGANIISGLTPSSQYTISATQTLGNIESAAASITSYTGPSAPYISVTSRTTGQIAVNLTENSTSSKFQVCIYSDSKCTPLSLSAGVTTKTFSSLLASTQYKVLATAVYQEITSEESEVTTYTGPSTPTVTPMTAQTTFSSINVTISGSEYDSIEACIYEQGGTQCSLAAANSTQIFSSLANAATAYIVRAKTIYQSISSSVQESTVYTASLAPTITVISTSENSITLQISEASASSFKACVHQSGAADCSEQSILNNQPEFPSLQSGENYTARAIAVFQSIESTTTIMQNIYTVPSAPTVNIGEITNNSIQINFTSSSRNIHQACIYQGDSSNCNFEAATSPKVFSNLQSASAYNVAVQSIYNGLASTSTTQVNIYTGTQAPSINITNQTFESITIKIFELQASSYKACVELTGSSACTPIAIVGDIKTFSGLIPSEAYTVRGIAIFKSLDSSEIVIDGIYTGPAAPNISVISVTQNSISVKFLPNSKTDSYSSCITQSSEDHCNFTEEANSRNFTNLNFTTAYLLKVKAVYMLITSNEAVEEVFTEWVVIILTTEREVKIKETLNTLADQSLLVMTMDVNNVSQWSIFYENPAGAFRINLTTGELFLRANVNINFENMAINPMLVTIKGSDVQPNIPDYHNLTIVVENVNDELPSWENLPTNVKVNENSQGEVIFTMTATDNDNDETVSPLRFLLGGAEGQFELSTASESGTNISASFSSPIFTASLKTTSTATLNYEMKDNYSLTLIASDGVNMNAVANLTVIVDDTLDEHPVITNLNETVTIPENTEYLNKTLLYTILFDNEEQDGVVIQIESATDEKGFGASSKFEVTNDGKLYITASSEFDFESSERYHLEISVTHAISNALYDEGYLDIVIENVNEQPFFVARSPQYLFEILEDSDITMTQKAIEVEKNLLESGRTLIDLSVQDPDAPVSSSKISYSDTIVYRIINQSSFGIFELDSICYSPQELKSSLITTANCSLRFNVTKLDTELIKTEDIDIFIEAIDGDGLKAEMQLKFKILNLNDNYPKFSKAMYLEVMFENPTIDSVVVQVSASDADFFGQPGIQEVYYYIVEQNVSEYLNINIETGAITVKKPFDRAAVGNWMIFSVEALDNGTLYDYTTVTVSSKVAINIRSQNEIRPFLLSSFFTTEIPFDAEDGYFIEVQIVANAASTGNASEVSVLNYRLVTESEYFQVNSINGKIYKSNASLRANQQYDVFVQAYDIERPQYATGIGMVRITTFDEAATTITCIMLQPESWLTEQRKNGLIDYLNAQWPNWIFSVENFDNETSSSINIKFYAYTIDENDVKTFVKSNVLLSTIMPGGVLHSIFTSGTLAEYRFEGCNASPQPSDINLGTFAGVAAGSALAAGCIILATIFLALKVLKLGSVSASAVTPVLANTTGAASLKTITEHVPPPPHLLGE